MDTNNVSYSGFNSCVGSISGKLLFPVAARLVYLVLRARAFRAGVRVQFFVSRGSIIPATQEGLSPKRYG